MGDTLKTTDAGNLFMVFAEPDVEIRRVDAQLVVEIRYVDVYDPRPARCAPAMTGDVTCWSIDADYNGESFFVRDAYFTGADEPYDRLQRALKADIDELAVHLAESPLIADAMASGEVSKAKAAELVRAIGLPDEVQTGLVDQARHMAVEQVAAAVERARLAHGASSPPVTPSLTITRRTDHATVEATVDLVDAEMLDVALSTAVETLDKPTTMPYSERRARALGAVARFFLDHQATVTTGRLGRPHVVVLVDLEVLEARTGGSGLLASGAVIAGDQARRLAEDANISRVITAGRSEPLDVGRSTRTIPPALAKAVIARDRHCKYEGCTSPPWACDIHHRKPWADGGPTALHNLGLVCWFHHQHVHRHVAAEVRATPDGRWTLAPRRAIAEAA